MTRPRLLATVLVAALLATLLGPTAVAQEDGTEKTQGPIPAGSWVGFTDFRGMTRNADISPEGTFTLEAGSGSVSGEFAWFGIASTSLAGPVSVDIAGVLSGTTDVVEFTITSVVANGISAPGPDLGGGAMVWTLVTCERVEGAPTRVDTRADVSEVRFWAIRNEAERDPAELFATVKQLQAEIDEVQEGFETGSKSPDALLFQLETLIATAEAASAELLRDPDCVDAFYQSVLAREFARLLKWALAEARLGGIEDALIQTIALMSVRAGILSPAGEYYNDALDADLRALVAERIDEAIGLSDQEALLSWWSVADLLGYDLLAEVALQVLGELA